MEILSSINADQGLYWVMLIFLITVFAGIIKGIVGFAMPLIMITGLATFLPLEFAIIAMIIPTLLTNFQQAFRDGIKPVFIPLKRYWKYLFVTVVAILICSQLMPLLKNETLFLLMGIPIFCFTLLQIFRIKLYFFNQNQSLTEIFFGFFAGFFGGLTGTWGPPTVSFFLTQQIDRKLQLRSQGIIYLFGSIAFIVGHIHSNIFTLDAFFFSSILCIPAMFGVFIGNKFGSKLNNKTFQTVTQLLLLLASLNLITRGLGF